MMTGSYQIPLFDLPATPPPEPCQPSPAFPGPGPGRGHRKTSNESILARWNSPGPAGFWNWCDDIRPRVLTRSNRYEVWEPTADQQDVVNQALAVDDDGRFIHSLSLNIQPRRHGKSCVFALLIIWLTTSRENHQTRLLGNTADHTKQTQYKPILGIIRNTPKLAAMFPEGNITLSEISFPPLSASIVIGEGISTSTSFGSRLNCYWQADYHASTPEGREVFNALQAATLDSEDSLIFICSNVDPTDGHVHSLEQAAKDDEQLYCHRVSYKNWDDYDKNAPAWINRKKAKRLERDLLPTEFKRDILGQRSDAKNQLFSTGDIKQAKAAYKTPVDDIAALVGGRKYVVGGGLDRAKSLSPLAGGDSTVWTVTAKVASPEHGEPEYFVLNQVVFQWNTDRHIKKQILADHQKYGLRNLVLENYEIVGLAPWLDDQKIPYEIVTATEKMQNSAFPEMARIFREGRFHFGHDLKTFERELKSFVYTTGRAGKHSFGAAGSRQHDDTVYSACHAIWSLREQVLHSYVLGHIHCQNKSPKRSLCYLMDGNLQMYCAADCPAHKQVEHFYMEFLRHQMDSELTLPEFFEAKVRLEGARVYQSR